jgi:hypothetical protein
MAGGGSGGDGPCLLASESLIFITILIKQSHFKIVAGCKERRHKLTYLLVLHSFVSNYL